MKLLPLFRKHVEPPTPEGEVVLYFHMSYGQTHKKSFRGKPGVAPEIVARDYIKEWGAAGFFELNGKFEPSHEVRSITWEIKKT